MNILPIVRGPVPAQDGSVLRDLFLDLTLYLNELTEDQLATVVDWYEKVAPAGALSKYTLEDLEAWDDVVNPQHLTKEGRAAAGRGERLPFLATVRRRIKDGRRFHVQFWDGAKSGPWSLNLRAPHYEDLGLRPFLRFIAPVETFEELPERANELAEMLSFHSGHGGLCFGYNQWFLFHAFDEIYARARRFWGIDVEHLNGTIRAVIPGIKGIGWLTLLGGDLVSEEIIGQIQSQEELTVTRRAGGIVVQVGDEPVLGDQNRPDGSLDPYFELARTLEPLFISDHDEFPGAFEDNTNTLGWIRRFIDPDSWR